MIKDKIISPIRAFISIEGFSGILLFIATIIALIWANSPMGDYYKELWSYELGVQTENFSLVKPLILWVNDGLMAIFFFLIGLEIKRELMIGELNSIRKATLPIFAAIGGILFPVSIFLLFNSDPATSKGWAIPMATDIAFSLAILKLLGNRVPLSLKIFLTAFAIVDDLAAVLVITIFYTGGMKMTLVLIALLLIALLFILSRINLYSPYFFILMGVVIWTLFLKAGIHPTIAGVLIAFTIPIRQSISVSYFTDKIREVARNIAPVNKNEKQVLSYQQIEQIDELETYIEEVQSPLQTLEHRLHGWVAYVVMPIFAIANAGIAIDNSGINYEFVLLLTACLVIGNSIGISLMTFIGIKTGLAIMPTGTTPMQLVGIGFLAGVGFTMSIFISTLAFQSNPALLDSAKIGVLIGSIISGGIGYLILYFSSNKEEEEEEELDVELA